MSNNTPVSFDILTAIGTAIDTIPGSVGKPFNVDQALTFLSTLTAAGKEILTITPPTTTTNQALLDGIKETIILIGECNPHEPMPTSLIKKVALNLAASGREIITIRCNELTTNENKLRATITRLADEKAP